MRVRPLALLALALAALLTAQAGSPDGGGAAGYGYSGAGAVVVSSPLGSAVGPGSVLLDNGAVVCDTASGSGLGGACVPFSEAPFNHIYVHDENVPDEELAFQVCIDNDGDGICGGPGTDPTGACGDEVVFSHGARNDTPPRFFNPLGPLPTSFRTGCPGGAWPGYVVILCAGVHSSSTAAGSESHLHEATRGSIMTADRGLGFGDFCGGSFAAKAYVVV